MDLLASLFGVVCFVHVWACKESKKEEDLMGVSQSNPGVIFKDTRHYSSCTPHAPMIRGRIRASACVSILTPHMHGNHILEDYFLSLWG